LGKYYDDDDNRQCNKVIADCVIITIAMIGVWAWGKTFFSDNCCISRRSQQPAWKYRGYFVFTTDKRHSFHSAIWSARNTAFY